jgi:hypothetical protein
MSERIYLKPVPLEQQGPGNYATINNIKVQKKDSLKKSKRDDKSKPQPLSPSCNKEKLKRLERQQAQQNKSARIFTEEVDKYIVKNKKAGEVPKVCEDIEQIKENMEKEQENLANKIKTLTLGCKSPGNTTDQNRVNNSVSEYGSKPIELSNSRASEFYAAVATNPLQESNTYNAPRGPRIVKGTVKTIVNNIERKQNRRETFVGKKRRTMKKNKNKKSVKKNKNKRKATMKKRIRQERKSNKKKTKQ